MALLTLGMFAHFIGIRIAFNEMMITLSVIVFGFALFVDKTTIACITCIVLSVFAVFHGYTQAAEIPKVIDTGLYFGCLLSMSLTIIILSAVVGRIVGNRYGQVLSMMCFSSRLFYLAAI